MAARVLTATHMGVREQLRRPMLLALLLVIPIIFITWGAKVTAQTPRDITIAGGWHVFTDMRTLMTVVDIPVTIAFLSGLVGVFVVSSALEGDRRLVIAGFSPSQAIVPRIAVLGAAVLVISLVSLIVGAFVFTPQQWVPFIAGNLLGGFEYAAIGALAGALIGRLGAVYLLFFLPNIDIGIAQDPLLNNGSPDGWATVLPGYGPTRMIVDSSFLPHPGVLVPLLISLAWIVVLGVALVAFLRHTVAPRG